MKNKLISRFRNLRYIFFTECYLLVFLVRWCVQSADTIGRRQSRATAESHKR